ncbi:CarD family transcriptional regulator [Gluconobacter albidus]|uniref:CarD family transcriptional regulator n=1 Tax=Gluconobacter albidus TaxID=318683 RepID=A0AAW3QWQ5_9PROT|nr:CarD family transcriptional regulator [Gluconobacter albidus]KXV37827.1 CarD family transcriptional regulator [Gluconobacter albidus]MBS1027544.1 CarD family transcriptional regulator [Gluconobacter albidus]MCP1272815.1 CarD family transcriptional regulator [Gluconobacter albidus]GBQ92483.1 CarD family transcriptional regulator [Gluconobacter albidus NBRC 3250]GLQ68128.1 CarD family transcriptional regulator [Gluconobacter albidus]
MNTFKSPQKGGMTDEMARVAANNTARQTDPEQDADPFHEGDSIVYAAHGVGRVEKIGMVEVADTVIEMIQISFPGNQMMLRIPLAKARKAGLRKIVTRDIVDKAMTVIKGKPHVSKGMWARRAVAYQEKINSGDLIQIAEVLRDLRRNVDSLDGSFSERKLFEAAQERFVAEVAVLENVDPAQVLENLTKTMKAA